MTSLPAQSETAPSVTNIRPHSSWLSLDLKGFWQARELLYFLTWRDIKVRYKQTAIGVFWVLLQPILTTVILTAIFSTFARFDTSEVPYPLFVLSGSVIWLFVQSAITASSNSFVNSTNLITKVFFPRLIMPIASTLGCGLDLLLSLPILAVVMIYFEVGFTWQVALTPVFLVMAFMQAGALGIALSALNIRFRDVKFALPFFLQIWMLASPIFYPATLLPARLKLLFALNPLTGIIEGFRSSLFGTPYDWPAIGVSAISIVVFLLVAVFIFRRMEDDFADMI